MKPKIVKLGWFQNGSFCKRQGNHNDLVCYWLVDCDASRRAAAQSHSSSSKNQWIFTSRQQARDAAKREA